MHRRDRARFDRLLEEVLAALPESIHDLLDETPLVVDDAPSRALLREMGMDPELDDLCGLHSGIPLTDRSIEHDAGLETIQIFREGIVEHAGGWGAGDAAISHEIRITLLHEIGHHYGLDEDDLERLGYA